MSRDHDLMQFHDGELSAEEAAQVRELLEREPQARAKLRGLAQTGDLVRLWADERSAGFDVADAVMVRLDAPARARSRVIELWLPAVAAVALAAAVALIVFGRGAPTRPSVPGTALTPPSQQGTLARIEPALPKREPAVAIESVDFGDQPGTIFMVGEGSGETPVIWLTDPPPDRHRMPL